MAKQLQYDEIARNAGIDDSVAAEKVKTAKSGTGFDAERMVWTDMVQAGIIVDLPKKEKAPAAMPSDYGDMDEY